MEITDEMRSRLSAGVAWYYVARDGRQWYIDSTLDESDTDFSDAMYDVWDGKRPYLGFPTLSIAQEAIETGSMYWRGEGWYRPVAFNWEDERLWCDTPEEVKELEDSMARRFDDRPYGVEYCGRFAAL